MLTCTFENHNQTSLRHVVVHALVVKNNQVLLVKRAPHLSNPNLYALPGGFVDRDETTAQAVVRELWEETGYRGVVTELFAMCDYPYRRGEDRQNIAFTYLVSVGEQTGQPDTESSALQWCDLTALPNQTEFAFDHFTHLAWYQAYLDNPQKHRLPVFVTLDPVHEV